MKRTILYLPFIVILALFATACGARPTPETIVEAAVSEVIETRTAEPNATPIEETSSQEMGPANKPEVVKSFDASRSELPEGVAIDNAGNIYVSLGPPIFVGSDFGQIRKIGSDGAKTALVEYLSISSAGTNSPFNGSDGAETVLVEYPDGPSPAGLAVDASGNVYYALPSNDDNTRGVYHLTDDGGTERLPGTENVVLPNGLALDEQGNLYVSDSILGAIWRIPSGEAAVAEIWFQHEWVAGCPEDPLGANGVAYGEGNLYAASTSKGLLVRIPILEDGSAGEPEIAAGEDDCDPEFDELDAMDGIALDVDGNVYALLVLQHKLVRIDPNDGSSTVLLTDVDGLWNPASIVFGVGKDNRESVFFTNYAVLPPAPDNSLGPAVLKFDVGVPGLPLP